MRKKSSGLLALIFSVLLAACAASNPAVVVTSAVNDDEAIVEFPSTTVIIKGVPFVRFSEAYRFDYPDANIVNASVPSSWAMVYKYFGQSLSALRDYSPRNWVHENGENADLEDVKRYVDRGIPVNVWAASTPYAHVIGLAQFMRAAIGGSGGANTITVVPRGVNPDQLFRNYMEGGDGGPNSGVLGLMEPFSTFRKLGDPRYAWDSLHIAMRTVIGYDDERQVLVVHNPSLGPAVEVSYSDFEKMWGPRGRHYFVAHPRDLEKAAAKRRAPKPYPIRTPDQRAAKHFVYAYALSSVGRVAEGEDELDRGLAIQGIGKAYEHFLLVEKAMHMAARGDLEGSTATLRSAIDLVPEHDRPWALLAKNQRRLGLDEEAAESEKKAEKLCKSSRASSKAAKLLTRDFFIFGCGGPGTLANVGRI
jgi:tetratricopeptide (TPR) repeat protein